MAYVTYTDFGGGSGQPVDEADFAPEDWAYHIEHGSIVRAGSEDDPNVLAAREAGGDYVDPRDAKIAELEAKLAAAGIDSDEDADESGPPVDPSLEAQAKVDAEQAK
jgi:hypothetical protein